MRQESPLTEHTDQSVLDGIAAGAPWADPTMNPATIDWATRQTHAAIPFRVVDGRPVIPGPSTGIRYGRNQLGHWGEQQCADALVIATDPDTGARWVVMVERADGNGWAIPGGYVEPGETASAAAVRELAEETGLQLPADAWTIEPARLVDDPRASDEAWMVTTVVRADIQATEDLLPAVVGTDDARRADWVSAASYSALTADLDARCAGVVFRAHRQLLAEALAG